MVWGKSSRPKKTDQPKTAELVKKVTGAAEEARRSAETYREKALKLFPWVCGRCGKEFDGKNLKELTVHHRDHNHDNNPPDGSNWELLCVYCHDNEHSRLEVADAYDTTTGAGQSETTTTYKAFAGLEGLLKDKKED